VFAPERCRVSWIRETPADQRGKRAESRRKGAQDGSWKARTPSGRTNRDRERKTATGSGRNIRMKRPTAASKGLLLWIWFTSDWMKLTLRRPASATRTLARAIERVSRSTPSPPPKDQPVGPPACYVPDSGTDIQNTLTWTNACFTEESFVTGARRAACRIRRSCSASVLQERNQRWDCSLLS